MKTLFVFTLTAFLIACGGETSDPAPTSSTPCGCSKYNKADCQNQVKCKWVVNDGCKCA